MGAFPWQSRRRAASSSDAPTEDVGQDDAVVGSASFLPGDHTVAEVLDYVGDDPTLAVEQAALERDGKARSTLLAKLDVIATGDDD